MPQAAESLTREAPAKINLALAVGPPRAGDGLHPICSWFAPIDLADSVTVTRVPDSGTSRCEVSWAPDAPVPSPVDWPADRDLAARAHRALEHAAERVLPAIVSVQKRIPAGGGLGGGSSDAAATLIALRDLFGLPLSNADLAPVALALGSDVPYFLLDPLSPAVVEGVGEAAAPSPSLGGAQIVLIFPPFGTPTGAVYRAFDEGATGRFRADLVRELAQRASLDSASLFNDLAEPAERVEPRIADLRRRAADAAGAPVYITGSGSTMFAVCPDGTDAERLLARLSAAVPGCRTLAARLL